jgi:uncharacterized spore protein YtfJ
VVETTVKETLEGVRDVLTVKRVFGEPFQKNGVTLIPAANVVGGGGGGQGESPEGDGVSRGFGTGFGVVARPAGAYVIRGDDVTWQPALDVNRMVAGLFVFAVLRLVFGRRRRSG